MDYRLLGSSLHGILQAKILEWVAILFSKVFSQHRDGAWVSCIAGRFFTVWAMREAQYLEGLYNMKAIKSLSYYPIPSQAILMKEMKISKVKGTS